MKKYTLIPALIFYTFGSFAQNNPAGSMLVRHDTTLLNADECRWIVKSLVKNDPSLTSEIGKPVPLIILEAIEKGRLKAIDPETNKPIPAKEIFTWKMPADTVPIYDNGGDIKMYQAVKRLHSSDTFKQIRIFQDWYFDITTGKFYTQIRWIELMGDISTSMGLYLGKVALCRIYY